MKRTAFIVLFASLCAAAGPALALVLHRGDSRPPDVIFREGFRASGTNVNPIDHVSGASCFTQRAPAEERSAYVALTETRDHAQYYGAYVYNVTPDLLAPDSTATFDVLGGLRSVAERWQKYGLNLRQRSAVDRMIEFPMSQRQHISRHIPPEWIRSVHVYRWDASVDRITLDRIEMNPGYREPAQTGSRPTFSDEIIAGIRHDAPPSRVTYVAASNGATLAACMVSESSCGSQSSRAWMQGNSARCVREPMQVPGDRFHQSVQMLLD
jgi:hypothetical protein